MYVNDPNMTGAYFRDFYPNVPGGANSLIRQGIHDKYGIDHTPIPVSLLVPGTNTITLIQRRATAATSSYVMYDYLDFELPTPPPAPPVLSFSTSGGQIQFNWPASYIGWRLETQTNSIMGTNWVTIPGATQTNLWFMPVTANNNVFFRLAHP
jgi:hypothetical protein